jgi:hypothetical protein
MDVDYVIPLHCSGEMFYELAKAEMPTKLLRSIREHALHSTVSVPKRAFEGLCRKACGSDLRQRGLAECPL